MSECFEGLRIVTRLGKRCIAESLQVQDSDKTKFRGAWQCQSTVKGYE